jgi:hypothetical protein
VTLITALDADQQKFVALIREHGWFNTGVFERGWVNELTD